MQTRHIRSNWCWQSQLDLTPEVVRQAVQTRYGAAAPRMTTRSTARLSIQPESQAESQKSQRYLIYSDLTADQKEELRILQQDYRYEVRRLETKGEALQDLCGKIQETTKKDFLPYTFGCESAYDMVVKLKASFAP